MMDYGGDNNSNSSSLKALFGTSSSSSSSSFGPSPGTNGSKQSTVSFSLEETKVYEYEIPTSNQEMLWYSSDDLKRIKSGLLAAEKQMNHLQCWDKDRLYWGCNGVDSYRGLESDNERAEREQRQSQAREEIFWAQLIYADSTLRSLKIAAALADISRKANNEALLRAKKDYEAAFMIYHDPGTEWSQKTENTQRNRWTP